MSRDSRRENPHDSGPLVRWVNVERLPQGRGAVTVEASPAECAALAADFKIPGLRDLVGRFAISGSTSRLIVTGTVDALVTQVCTVSLEPFESAVEQSVELSFAPATDPLSEPRGRGGRGENEVVPPLPVGGNIRPPTTSRRRTTGQKTVSQCGCRWRTTSSSSASSLSG